MLFRSSCLFEHTLTTVSTLPEYQSCKYNVIQTFYEPVKILYIFDQTNLYRIRVRLEVNGANAPLIASPPSPSPCYPTTPPPSRWPALTTSPSLAKFHLVWRRLCEALLSSSSLAGEKHLSLLSRLYLKCRRHEGRLGLNMKIKSSIICGHSSGCVHSDVHSSTIVERPIEYH